MSRPRTLIPHGTATGYTNHRCRCELCREAWRVYARTHLSTPASSRRWVLAAQYVRDNLPDVWEELGERARD